MKNKDFFKAVIRAGLFSFWSTLNVILTIIMVAFLYDFPVIAGLVFMPICAIYFIGVNFI